MTCYNVKLENVLICKLSLFRYSQFPFRMLFSSPPQNIFLRPSFSAISVPTISLVPQIQRGFPVDIVRKANLLICFLTYLEAKLKPEEHHYYVVRTAECCLTNCSATSYKCHLKTIFLG